MYHGFSYYGFANPKIYKHYENHREASLYGINNLVSRIKEYISKELSNIKSKKDFISTGVCATADEYEYCKLYAKRYLYLFDNKINLDELTSEFYIYCLEYKNKGKNFKILGHESISIYLMSRLFFKYYNIIELSNKFLDDKEFYNIYKDINNVGDLNEDVIYCVIQNIFENELKDSINEALDTINPRCSMIIQQSFGINGYELKNDVELGKLFEVTHERIRQLKCKGLRMLKHPSRTKKLIEFMKEC